MPLPPFVLVRCLRCSDDSISASLVYGAFAALKCLSSPLNDFLGPTGLGNDGGSNGLPNDTA